jgi:hypothetical protein
MSNNSKKQTNELDAEIEKRNKLCEIYISLENNGLVTKTASLQDTRISYCRGKDLVKFFNENKEKIAKKIYSICGEDIGKGENAINNFYHV